MPRLRHLCLSWCHEITARGLNGMPARVGPGLTALDLCRARMYDQNTATRFDSLTVV